MTPNRTPLGIGLMVAFCILAPLLDMCSKLATETIPVGQITMARFVGQLVFMLPVALVLRPSLRASGRDLWLTFWRAAFLIGSTFCFIAGVAVMPIADALAIVFVMPFITMFLVTSIATLRERQTGTLERLLSMPDLHEDGRKAPMGRLDLCALAEAYERAKA